MRRRDDLGGSRTGLRATLNRRFPMHIASVPGLRMTQARAWGGHRLAAWAGPGNSRGLDRPEAKIESLWSPMGAVRYLERSFVGSRRRCEPPAQAYRDDHECGAQTGVVLQLLVRVRSSWQDRAGAYDGAANGGASSRSECRGRGCADATQADVVEFIRGACE